MVPLLAFNAPPQPVLGKVNIQDFLQVFQGSGIGKMEDNLTSADSLSYTTNGSRVDLENRVSVKNYIV